MERRHLNSYEALCLGWISQVFQGCLADHSSNPNHGLAFETLMASVQDFLIDPEIDLGLMFTEIGILRAIEGRDCQYQIGFRLGFAFVAIPRLLCELFDSTTDECILDQGEFLTGLAVGMCDGYGKFMCPNDSILVARNLGAIFAKACSCRVNPDLKHDEDNAVGQSIAEAKRLLRRQFFESFHGGMVEERMKMNQTQKQCLNSGIGGAMNVQIFHKFLRPTPNQIFEALS